MSGSPQRETPHLGIFWVVQTTDGDARLLAAGCPLDQAKPFGDCLTYGPGHYETWARCHRLTNALASDSKCRASRRSDHSQRAQSDGALVG